MGTVELWILMYVCMGGLVALVTLRRGGHRGSALAALVGWPLWAPLALLAQSKPAANMVERIDAALRDGVEATRGTPLSAMLSDEARQRIVEEAAATEHRCQALETLLADAPCSDQQEAKLRALHQTDLGQLRELARLTEALRGQLVVARLADAPTDAPGALVSELWGRVERRAKTLRKSTPPRALAAQAG